MFPLSVPAKLDRSHLRFQTVRIFLILSFIPCKIYVNLRIEMSFLPNNSCSPLFGHSQLQCQTQTLRQNFSNNVMKNLFSSPVFNSVQTFAETHSYSYQGYILVLYSSVITKGCIQR